MHIDTGKYKQIRVCLLTEEKTGSEGKTAGETTLSVPVYVHLTDPHTCPLLMHFLHSFLQQATRLAGVREFQVREGGEGIRFCLFFSGSDVGTEGHQRRALLTDVEP